MFSVFERFAEVARNASVVIAPAMVFYGGLGDLLATEAMERWDAADEICIAVALDSWQPTRDAIQASISFFSNNRLERADTPLGRIWNFPAPLGPSRG